MAEAAHPFCYPLQAPQVIFSDSSEPGEGEHKILRFIRQQRTQARQGCMGTCGSGWEGWLWQAAWAGISKSLCDARKCQPSRYCCLPAPFCGDVTNLHPTTEPQPDYDPNTRHCIFGQDADLILLGLLS